MTITINDLPVDILIYIFSMCEEDNLDKDPYLLWNYKDHRITRSIMWVSTLPKLPELFFHRSKIF